MGRVVVLGAAGSNMAGFCNIARARRIEIGFIAMTTNRHLFW